MSGSTLDLGGHTAQAFVLEQPPELAYRYFANNEALLKQFLGEDRVAYLGDGVYRVALNPHGALGLTLRPSFDVAFIEHPPDRVEMRSLRAQLLEASHLDAVFEARFEGEARFEPHPHGTRVACWAHMHVTIGLPPAFTWMPTRPLQALGNGIIQAAMGTLAKQLVPIMQRDIRGWAAARASGA